ncbi:short-chain dehydrogenase/reductase SDR (plasmid) [Haloterrigena turkmenica DSM 5511]|uniref:Short-chain dehydrogenase/reductase SDR n=1 Tax=Haloterrigena turkmenica (strain ATCC 51198 / DSM 5511 / JCM 9101 / NCIMB 13204 / VKM B-1734 / 4k) TaxID=543526 RepID=D2S015_HALTV|nr:mycofactocin-coupled SDR family oxidoreductase [Haloterrigena turkmenica]ADB62712.1 short-chain dehydrogenase/reductase SDR [Haloterrigena turkmenica DSM 5511]
MPEYDFSDTVAFVTGAAHGQGRSHAQYYAKHGADVVVTDIAGGMDSVPYDLGTEDELDETAGLVEDEGQEALALGVDVRDEDDVQSAVEEAVDHFGHIDVLANNAGIVTISDMVEMDELLWDEMIDTNLKGVWLCAKHVGKHFVDRGDGGKIVSTSSTAGLVGNPGAGHYSAAKHGVIGLTKTLVLELAEYDVNVNAVCPTVVGTPMITGMTEAYGEEVLEEIGELAGQFNVFEDEDPAIESRDISEAYMWLSSDAARYVTGIALPVDAGMTSK